MIKFIINCVLNFFPIKNTIVFESNPDFNDETYWICEKFMSERMYEKYKIYWILKKHEDIKIPKGWKVSFIYQNPRNVIEQIKKHYILHTAKCILDSCQFVPKSRKVSSECF